MKRTIRFLGIGRRYFRSAHLAETEHPKWGHVPNEKDKAFASRRIKGYHPDIVIADQVFMTDILDTIPDRYGCLKVVLAHDIRSSRLKSYNDQNVDFDEVVRYSCEDEARSLRKAQLIIAIQDDEAAALKAMAPQADVLSMLYAVEPKPTPRPQVRGRLLFVGSRANHNVHGLKWFLREAWPKIRAKVPHAILHVCGEVYRDVGYRDNRVRFCGIVNDLSGEYGEAEAVIVPIFCGSGLKVKLLEALSYGRACVSTNIGLEGLSGTVSDAVLQADDAQGFADAVIKLLTDPQLRARMQENALCRIGEGYGADKVYGPVVKRFYEWALRKRS